QRWYLAKIASGVIRPAETRRTEQCPLIIQRPEVQKIVKQTGASTNHGSRRKRRRQSKHWGKVRPVLPGGRQIVGTEDRRKQGRFMKVVIEASVHRPAQAVVQCQLATQSPGILPPEPERVPCSGGPSIFLRNITFWNIQHRPTILRQRDVRIGDADHRLRQTRQLRRQVVLAADRVSLYPTRDEGGTCGNSSGTNATCVAAIPR